VSPAVVTCVLGMLAWHQIPGWLFESHSQSIGWHARGCAFSRVRAIVAVPKLSTGVALPAVRWMQLRAMEHEPAIPDEAKQPNLFRKAILWRDVLRDVLIRDKPDIPEDPPADNKLKMTFRAQGKEVNITGDGLWLSR
jgi:hypothetical protein